MPHFFTYCPKCKSEEISKNNEKNFHCPSCGFVYYHNVASACAVIIEYRGKVLFTVRKYDPGKSTLDLPGGFVDYNENVENALKREVMEELNLQINDPEFFASFPNIYRYKDVDYHTLDFIFIASVDSLEGLKANDDVADYVLLGPVEIDIGKIGLTSIKKAISHYLQQKA